MMHLNFVLAALFVANAAAAPVPGASHNTPTLQAPPQVPTPGPHSIAVPSAPVPTTIEQLHHRALGLDRIHLPATAAGAIPIPPFGHGGLTVRHIQLPTATIPNADHLPRQTVDADAEAEVEVDAEDCDEVDAVAEAQAEVHARAIGLSTTLAGAIPIPPFGHGALKVRHVQFPTVTIPTAAHIPRQTVETDAAATASISAASVNAEAEVEAEVCAEVDVEAEAEAEVHARAFGPPTPALPAHHLHTTTTVSSIRGREMHIPTSIVGATTSKVTSVVKNTVLPPLPRFGVKA